MTVPIVDRSTFSRFWAAALCIAASTPSLATDPSVVAQTDSQIVSKAPNTAPAEPALPGPTAIPAGTLVALRIDQTLSSQTSRRGDKFSLTLVNDLWLGNQLIVPAGTKGTGEVIHAAGKGFGGRAGELIVTARYLEFNGRQVPIRGFRLAVAGADNATPAIITSSLVPIAGLFVTGTSATIGLGQLAQAKLAESIELTATSAPIANVPTEPMGH